MGTGSSGYDESGGEMTLLLRLMGNARADKVAVFVIELAFTHMMYAVKFDTACAQRVYTSAFSATMIKEIDENYDAGLRGECAMHASTGDCKGDGLFDNARKDFMRLILY